MRAVERDGGDRSKGRRSNWLGRSRPTANPTAHRRPGPSTRTSGPPARSSQTGQLVRSVCPTSGHRLVLRSRSFASRLSDCLEQTLAHSCELAAARRQRPSSRCGTRRRARAGAASRLGRAATALRKKPSLRPFLLSCLGLRVAFPLFRLFRLRRICGLCRFRHSNRNTPPRTCTGDNRIIVGFPKTKVTHVVRKVTDGRLSRPRRHVPSVTEIGRRGLGRWGERRRAGGERAVAR